METKLIPLSVSEKDIDWEVIELFRRRFNILWGNLKDLKLGQFTGSFSIQNNGSYKGSFNLPNEYRLKGLYVDFRHFYLNDEPTNVHKFANYLSSLTGSDEYRKFIKQEKKKLKSKFVESGWLKYKGKPFTTKEILDIWFNSEIFHNDRKKTSVLLDWMEILAADTAKSMLFMAVYDSILIVRNINWSALELSKENLYLRMPNKVYQAVAIKPRR